MWSAAELHTESDVEQKFLYPLMTEARPLGLGLPGSVILTKTNIRSLPIGKGTSKKIYYPDYLVSVLGLPVLIIEAKRPGESIEEGFREARLYASELNALFDHGIAPARFVVACNGVELWYGYSDQAEPMGREQCSSLGAYSLGIAEIVSAMCWESLRKWAGQIVESTKPVELAKPRRLLGGVGIQNEEVGINTFGATLASIISPVGAGVLVASVGAVMVSPTRQGLFGRSLSVEKELVIGPMEARLPLDDGAREWGRRNGVNPEDAVDQAHGIKHGDPMARPGDKWTTDTETGEVRDPDGEVHGQLTKPKWSRGR